MQRILIIFCLLLNTSAVAYAAELVSATVTGDLKETDLAAPYWKKAKVEKITLMAQPMVAPRPKTTTTAELEVQSVHNASEIAFRVRWKDTEKSEAGRLGEFSDALAIQFPVKTKEPPPPVFMGAKDDPVHIFHWRAQYQRDVEKGKPEMKDLYPNISIDIYPMEYPDWGKLEQVDAQKREVFSPGKASGNPQSYEKSGVDEIFAEGFSTSSVQIPHGASAHAKWENGQWTLIIVRPLMIEGGSTLTPGGKSNVAFAAWQGGKGEVGSRKCVTMMWTPLLVQG